jgi:hypothetical protein
MNQPATRGVHRQGVDATFEADEARKSHLMLEALMLRTQGRPDAAADKLAEAAGLEEQLRDVCLAMGLMDKAFVHGFSAASCRAQAGDFHHAIVLCHDLLAHGALPKRLRKRIRAYAKTLCARRARWYEELVLHDTGDVGES